MALSLVKEIIFSKSINHDVKLLEELYLSLQSQEKDDIDAFELTEFTQDKDELEQNFLSKSKVRLSPVPQAIISESFEYDRDLICKFVFRIFEKQFGWAERSSSDAVLETDKETLCRQELNSSCENFTTWFEYHDHLSYNLLHGYCYALKSSSSIPFVRKQIIYSVFRWFKNLSCKTIIVPDKCYNILKNIVILGMTDVWSAIRKDTSSRINSVLELLTEEKLENLFLALIKICHTEKAPWETVESWQSTEGAIRGIDKMLTSCKYVATSSVCKSNDVTTPSVLIRIGKSNFKSLPPFIKDNIESTLFKLFAHSQFSIREIAGKTFSAFLNKSEFSYLIKSFEKIVRHLKKYVYEQDGITMKFMNACAAEGFMNVVLFLVKSVPLSNLVCKWSEYWSVFSHYLIHPASTVRQTASTVFKYLVSKELSTTYQMKLVLQGLCALWKTDVEKMTKLIHSGITETKGRKSVCNCENINDLPSCWEWREGRLFAYELIMKFLITNHIYFSSTSHRKRISNNQSLNNSIAEGQFRRAFSRHSTISHTRADMPRKTLTKSFTLSQVTVLDAEVVEKTAKVPSLLSLSKTEQGDDELPFGIESLPSLQLKELTDSKSDVDLDQQVTSEKTVLKWLSEQKYCSCSMLLKQVLLQTIECLHDSRWELRRMSRQLLPNVCEVITYYDYGLLERLYTQAFTSPNSELHFGACLCLLHCIKFYIRLKRTTSDKLSPAKSIDRRKSNATELLSVIELNMRTYVIQLSEQLNGTTSDETSHLIILILLIYQITFNNEPSLDDTICRYLNSSWKPNLSSSSSSSSPIKNEAKPLIDLLCELQSYLTEYCDQTDIKHTILLLPVLLQSMHLSQSNSLDVHIILNCAEIIMKRTVEEIGTEIQQFFTYFVTSCEEFVSLMESTELEFHYLRQAFNIAFALQSVMTVDFPIKLISHAVERKRKTLQACNQGSICLGSPILSGRDRVSASDDLLSYSTTSFDSTRMSDNDSTSSAKETESDEEGSDWDWSSGDENEKNELPLLDLYKEFLQQLKERQINEI